MLQPVFAIQVFSNMTIREHMTSEKVVYTEELLYNVKTDRECQCLHWPLSTQHLRILKETVDSYFMYRYQEQLKLKMNVYHNINITGIIPINDGADYNQGYYIPAPRSLITRYVDPSSSRVSQPYMQC